MNWLKNNYKIGNYIECPHPLTGKIVKCQITNHTIDTINKTQGIMVRFADGGDIEIESSYLDEKGGGV